MAKRAIITVLLMLSFAVLAAAEKPKTLEYKNAAFQSVDFRVNHQLATVTFHDVFISSRPIDVEVNAANIGVILVRSSSQAITSLDVYDIDERTLDMPWLKASAADICVTTQKDFLRWKRFLRKVGERRKEEYNRYALPKRISPPELK